MCRAADNPRALSALRPFSPAGLQDAGDLTSDGDTDANRARSMETLAAISRRHARDRRSVARVHGGASGRAAQPSKKAARVPVFEVDPSWPKLPNNWIVGHVASVAVDRRDHVWILHRPNTIPEDRRGRAAPPVLEFDTNGKFVNAWGGPGTGYDWPDSEHGIAVDYRDHVWIGGSAPVAPSLRNLDDDMLLKFDNKGKFLLQIGGRTVSGGNNDPEERHQSADVFVYPKTNEAFVADGYGNRRVIVFDADTGAFKRMWGAFGNEPVDVRPAGRGSRARRWRQTAAGAAAPAPARHRRSGIATFGGPVHAVKVSNDALVYVADRPNRRVQVFTPDGKFVTQTFINRSGPLASVRRRPGVLARCATAVPVRRRLRQFAHRGPRSQEPPDPLSVRQRSDEPGDFQGLHHLAIDSKGNLYTGEVAPGARAQRFVFKGLSDTLPANALTPAQLAPQLRNPRRPRRRPNPRPGPGDRLSAPQAPCAFEVTRCSSGSDTGGADMMSRAASSARTTSSTLRAMKDHERIHRAVYQRVERFPDEIGHEHRERGQDGHASVSFDPCHPAHQRQPCRVHAATGAPTARATR